MTRPDVLLIHGFGCDGSFWEPQLIALSDAGYSVTAPDLPCHGELAAKVMPSLDAIAEWVAGLCAGGPAALVCRLTTPDVARRFRNWARKNDIPVTILGAGSNILATDEGFPGLVMMVDTAGFAVQGRQVTAGAGLAFDDLIVSSLEADLVGLEFASGIPGTLGGAIMGNAGCYGHEIGEFVRQALVLTSDGRIETVTPDDFGFDYRLTRLRETGAVLLEATLALTTGDVSRALLTRREHMADRRAKHPVDIPCAGSWFRNLPAPGPGQRRQPAGRLLEEAGAKTMREGDARVFDRHANIIINTGSATSAQISRLAHRMREAVRERFGILLEEEVRRIPPADDTAGFNAPG